MKRSDSIKEIAKALYLVQGAAEIAKKLASGYNYKFADYCTVWKCVQVPLFENELSVVQDAVSDENGVSVTTTLMHTSGEWLEFGPLTIPMGKRDAHSTGSSISYARRYALCAALHIVSDDDDDGAAAQKAGPAPKPKPKPKPKVAPLSDGAMEAWVEKWSDTYDLCNLQDYCEARAKHLGHSIHQTCGELAADEKLFVKNIDVWLKQNPPQKS